MPFPPPVGTHAAHAPCHTVARCRHALRWLTRAATLAAWLLGLIGLPRPAMAACVLLDYRLPEADTAEAREALARGLAAHLDWLHAHGVRFVNEGVESGNVPTVCLSFSGPSSLLDAVVTPLLTAWSAPSRQRSADDLAEPMAAADPYAGAGAGGRIVLTPSASIAELVDALAALGLRARSSPPPESHPR